MLNQRRILFGDQCSDTASNERQQSVHTIKLLPFQEAQTQEIMLALLYDYRTNLDRYQERHAYFREHQPPTLIPWGSNDPIFPPLP